MNNELEMKFVINGEGHSAFQALLPKLTNLLGETSAIDVDYQQKQLTNQYFDTQDFFFAKHKFGFRVRGCNDEFEQTLKTQGLTVGGLHQRGEYNVPIADAQPDLTLFDDVPWPDDERSEALNSRLVERFATNFKREQYQLTIGEDVLEVVFDQGEVITENDSMPIDEVEIELKKGDVKRVFQLARLLNQHLSLRLSDTTKAAMGYTLMGEARWTRKPLPE